MKQIRIAPKELEEAVNRVSGTEDGQVFLALLCRESGFLSNKMNLNDPNHTQVLAAMRGIYAKIRKHIPQENLLKAEYGIIFTKEDDDRS